MAARRHRCAHFLSVDPGGSNNHVAKPLTSKAMSCPVIVPLERPISLIHWGKRQGQPYVRPAPKIVSLPSASFPSLLSLLSRPSILPSRRQMTIQDGCISVSGVSKIHIAFVPRLASPRLDLPWAGLGWLGRPSARPLAR